MKTSAGQSSTSLLCLPIPVGSRANRKEPNYFWFADDPLTDDLSAKHYAVGRIKPMYSFDWMSQT